MTISSTTNRVSYSGNGVTTAFSFPYYFLAEADLVVVLRVTATGVETTQTITTHYTVSGEGEPAGGTVTFLSAPATGRTVTIYRDVARTQGLDLVENDALPAESLEESLDKMTMISQRLSDRMDRAMRLSEGYTATFDTTLPAELTAECAIIINEDGDGFAVGPTSDEISNAQNYAVAAEAAQTAAEAAQTAAELAETNAETAETNAEAAYASTVALASTLVVGPASSTDTAIVLFDGATGKLARNSVVTVTAAGIVSGVTQFNVDNLRLDGNTVSSQDANGNIILLPNGTGNIGLGVTPSSAYFLDVQSPTDDEIPLRISTVTAATAAASNAAVIRGVTSGNMADDFGAQIIFQIRDDAATDNNIGTLRWARDGADNSGKFNILTRNAGASVTAVTVRADGDTGIGTAAPSTRLHVYENTASAVAVRVENSEGYFDLSTDGAVAGIRPNGNAMFFVTNTGAIVTSSGSIAASAKFEVQSTTQGSIPAPVHTTAQQDAVSSPAAGLQVYNSTQAMPKYSNGTVWGSFATIQPAATKTGNYTTTTADDVILVDATSGAITITLHSSATFTRRLTIKKIDSSVNVVTVDGNASETIDGTTTKTLLSQYESMTLVSNGSNYFRV